MKPRSKRCGGDRRVDQSREDGRLREQLLVILDGVRLVILVRVTVAR